MAIFAAVGLLKPVSAASAALAPLAFCKYHGPNPAVSKLPFNTTQVAADTGYGGVIAFDPSAAAIATIANTMRENLGDTIWFLFLCTKSPNKTYYPKCPLQT